MLYKLYAIDLMYQSISRLCLDNPSMSRKFACTLGIGIGSILTLLATHYISDVNQLVEVQSCSQFSLPPQSLPEPQTETQNKKPSEEPSEKCKKDENGEEADQKVEKRKDCPEEGFNEENLIKLNSDVSHHLFYN